MPKWARDSEKKGCSGTRIPASSACAYTHTAPGGGGELARTSPPAGREVYYLMGTPYFLHTSSTSPCVRRNETMEPASTCLGGTTTAAPSSRSEVSTW
ncbi:hypothetical protein ZWY2020_026974 [Hordeum vulgare]|nr:hypothetical protein ZWY2020_026969 [Hordeum vulgare]KAI5002324.1 hypothetical protein ZWY2020_026974 [Hordeum vulgare]